MDELAALIAKVRDGNADAYEPIVRRFQNMAVGYGYAVLGDFQLAEDAAQETFIDAYFELPNLREPSAFPGWFRRILIKQIDRIRRSSRLEVDLDAQTERASKHPTPFEVVEENELQAMLHTAFQCLSPEQRETVTLFYIGDYSQSEISTFLDVPVSTVKMRLYHARHLLQHHLLTVIEDKLPKQRPSRNNTFTEKIMSYQVEPKLVPSMKVISLTRSVLHRDLQAHLDGSINAMMVVAEATGAQIAGLPFSIYHSTVSEDQAGEVEVCLPIRGDIGERADMHIKEIPETRVAFATLTMRQSIFPGVLKGYEAIRDWITSHHQQPSAAAREVYLNFQRSIFSPVASLDAPCVEINWPY